MPGLYSPVNEDGQCLADGDLLKSKPLFQITESIYKRKDKFLEFRLENNETKKKISNTIEYLNAVYDTISGFATDNIINRYKDFENCDFIKINLENVSVVDFMVNKEKKREMAKKGYDSTIKYFNGDYIKKKETFVNFYKGIKESLEKMIFYIEKNNLDKAKIELLEILSNPKLSRADNTAVSEIEDFKTGFYQNFKVKKGLFYSKSTLLNKKEIIKSAKILLNKIVSNEKQFIV